MALGMNGITVRLAVERAFALRGMRTSDHPLTAALQRR